MRESYSSQLADGWERALQHPREDLAPLPISQLVLEGHKSGRVGRGLYIGIGEGRNFIPLVRAGVDLDGVDLSKAAINRANRQLPGRERRHHWGDFARLAHRQWSSVIVSRCLVEGDFAQTLSNLGEVASLLKGGGTLFLQVPAVGTDLHPDWLTNEITGTGGRRVTYPGAAVARFYLSELELDFMLKHLGLRASTPPELVSTRREDGTTVTNWLVVAHARTFAG